jgi:hypothetical protein
MAHRKPPSTLFEAYKKSYGPQGQAKRVEIPGVHATPMTETQRILGQTADKAANRVSGFVFESRGGPPPVPAPRIPGRQTVESRAQAAETRAHVPDDAAAQPRPEAAQPAPAKPRRQRHERTAGAKAKRTTILDTDTVVIEMTRNAQTIAGVATFGLLALFLGLGFMAGGGLGGGAATDDPGGASVADPDNAGGRAAVAPAGRRSQAGRPPAARSSRGNAAINTGGGGPYSVRVTTVTLSAAERVKRELETKKRLSDVWIKRETGGHVVYVGHFPSSRDPAALALRDRIQNMDYAGEKWFKDARIWKP